MTSRLKRKLNDLGVDTASHKATENFCLIGTPLPPLEKSKDTGEFVPLWKQEVRDEKGRRRLHGAFTGGFSAGYFNTVGSKEGWAPSTFVSSRADRAKKKELRPEDYMDEEDLAELRESRKLVDENEEMDFGGTEAEMRRRAGTQAEDDPMANALAAALAPPPQDSIGARILRKMGWRMGQGVGPRVTYEQRRAQDRAARAAPGVQEDGAEDDEAKKHLYPRRDTPLLIVQRKDNSHGLGYHPGLGLNESLGREGAKQGPNIAAGFGLGALNDADEDDLDVYDGALRPGAGRRVAYEAGEDEDVIMMGSSRQPNRHPPNRGMPSTITTQTFRDGRPVLKGFVVAEQPVSDDRWFPLPEVPAGWKPNPKRIWDAGKNKENQEPTKERDHVEPPKTHAEWKNSLLSADERGSMLGETPLPSKPRSVFDFMSQKDRERLERAREALNNPAPTPPITSDVPSSPPDPSEIPHLHPSVAKAALSGFQPFQSDPVKHARYSAFLQHASLAEPNAPLALGPLPGQRPEDFRRELADYAKSAAVFKPLSGAMASRFQSAVIIENGPKVFEGLHQPVHQEADEEEAQQEEKKKEEEDPKKAAVRLGMYGPLTREVVPWQPARLLCKRFSVREPEVDMSAADEAAASSAGVSVPVPEQSAPEPPLAITDGSASGEATVTSGGRGRSGPRNLANIGLGEDEDQGRDTLTYERPAMDVFKAIFASDDEDSDDGEDEKDVSEPPAAAAPAGGTAAVSQAAGSQTPDVKPSTNTVDQPVDLGTFKPTFVPRSDRESRKDKTKDKKEKKKKAKTLVSFDTEEEGLQVTPVAAKREKHKDKDKNRDKDGERKKKKRKEKQNEEDDDSMWVEAPAPEVVQHLEVKPLPPHDSPKEESTSSAVAGPLRGRKRAVDFM